MSKWNEVSIESVTNGNFPDGAQHFPFTVPDLDGRSLIVVVVRGPDSEWLGKYYLGDGQAWTRRGKHIPGGLITVEAPEGRSTLNMRDDYGNRVRVSYPSNGEPVKFGGVVQGDGYGLKYATR